MRECRKIQPLIAASLYEALEEAEAQRLEKHLALCADCREEAAGLQAMVAALPVDQPIFEGDLRPVLRESLRQEGSPGGRGRRWRWLAPATASLALVFFAGLITLNPPISPDAPMRIAQEDPAPADTAIAASEHRQESEAALRLAQADDLLAARNYTGALKALQGALARYPEAPEAGAMQHRIAEIEFASLQRYPQAFEAYQTLRRDYGSVFSADPMSVARYELLAEAQAEEFKPLYALDAARTSSQDAFAQLEKVVARYPGTMIASSAIESMCALSLEAGREEGGAPLIKQVLAQCNEAAAIAALNMHLGDHYWHDLQDPALARPFYEEVAQGQEQALAALAQHALSEIDSSGK